MGIFITPVYKIVLLVVINTPYIIILNNVMKTKNMFFNIVNVHFQNNCDETDERLFRFQFLFYFLIFTLLVRREFKT